MPNWENGCIYMLRHKDDVELENVYIGSTTNFRGRKYEHKTGCNNPNIKNYNGKKYQYIRDNGGWDEWKMVWIEDYPCESKKELLLREDEVMLQYQNRLNQNRAHTTHEEKKEQKKEHRQANREKILEKQKEHYQANREKILEYHKEYQKDNKEKIAEYKKEHYQANRDKLLERQKENYQANKEKIAEKIKCDICGCESRIDNLTRHQKTAKCINYKMST